MHTRKLPGFCGKVSWMTVGWDDCASLASAALRGAGRPAEGAAAPPHGQDRGQRSTAAPGSDAFKTAGRDGPRSRLAPSTGAAGPRGVPGGHLFTRVVLNASPAAELCAGRRDATHLPSPAPVQVLDGSLLCFRFFFLP